MSFSLRKHLPLKPALCALALIAGTTVSAAGADDTRFLTENGVAMRKMMAAMEIKPSGDADRDFVAMMVPHHQGAIDMAQTILRYGKNEQLRRLAQEIIVTQQQEIAAMRLAVGDPLPPSVPSPNQPSLIQVSPAPAHDRHSMPHGSMMMSPGTIMK